MEFKTSIVYVADDGTQFVTEAECKAYEEKTAKVKAEREEEERMLAEEKKRLRELNTVIDIIPLTEHTLDPELWYFRWFKVNNEDDYKFIDSIVEYGTTKPDQYPAYICLESEDDPLETVSATYADKLRASIEEAKWFFKQFGYDCVITKKEE